MMGHLYVYLEKYGYLSINYLCYPFLSGALNKQNKQIKLDTEEACRWTNLICNIMIKSSNFILAQLQVRGLLYWPEADCSKPVQHIEDAQLGQYEII